MVTQPLENVRPIQFGPGNDSLARLAKQPSHLRLILRAFAVDEVEGAREPWLHPAIAHQRVPEHGEARSVARSFDQNRHGGEEGDDDGSIKATLVALFGA